MLSRKIAQRLPLTVSEYVETCLYDPAHGFYMRPGGRAGRSGHFLTSPEVGPLFGTVLARALDAWWAELGEPSPFTVVDWGSGPGTLVRSLLAARPDCMSAGALRLVALEVSAAQRWMHPRHELLSSAASLEDVLADGVGAGVIVANELLDNLPFDILRRGRDDWEQLLVVSGDDERRFDLEAVTASPSLAKGLPDVEVGSRVPVQHAARRWVDRAHQALSAGRIVVFDYGADTAELAARCSSSANSAESLGWLRVHRNHQQPADWLADPGAFDITADVAFDQVQADHLGELCSQADFLLTWRAHGIDELVDEGRAAWAANTARAGVGDLAAIAARSRVSFGNALQSSQRLRSRSPHRSGGNGRLPCAHLANRLSSWPCHQSSSDIEQSPRATQISSSLLDALEMDCLELDAEVGKRLCLQLIIA